MISLAGLLVLTAAAAFTAAVATGLTLAAGASWPHALLAGGAAGGSALALLPSLIDRGDDC